MLNEQFIIEAMTGDRTSEHCFISHAGVGSSSHCLHIARCSDAAMSSAVTAVPKVSSGGTSHASTVSWLAAAADARKAASLLLKNAANSLPENGMMTVPDGCSSALSRRQRVFEFSLSLIALHQ